MKTPHKHAALIKAWADGAEIEVQLEEDYWIPANPDWRTNLEYRIKPELKPDVVMYANVNDARILDNYSYKLCGNFNIIRTPYDNLKLTWDGKTGILKAAEVIA